LRDGERGREKRWRERVRRWFLSKTVIFGFDHRPKSTRDILRYRYWSYLHKVISRRLQILKSLVQGYFYFPTVFLVLMTSARITQMFSTKYHCTTDLLFDWFGISCMTTDNFCFYFQNRLILSSQTGGLWYSDTSPFSIPLNR